MLENNESCYFRYLQRQHSNSRFLHLQLLFLLQTCSMQGIECRFCNFAKMESWCGSSFHRLYHDSDQSQQKLECGHHPTSWESIGRDDKMQTSCTLHLDSLEGGHGQVECHIRTCLWKVWIRKAFTSLHDSHEMKSII